MPHPVLVLNCKQTTGPQTVIKATHITTKTSPLAQSSGGFHDHDFNRKNPKHLYFHIKGVIL